MDQGQYCVRPDLGLIKLFAKVINKQQNRHKQEKS